MVGIHKHKTTSSLGRNGNEKVMRGKCRGVRNKRPVACGLWLRAYLSVLMMSAHDWAPRAKKLSLRAKVCTFCTDFRASRAKRRRRARVIQNIAQASPRACGRDL
jgi:hypothetical protein